MTTTSKILTRNHTNTLTIDIDKNYIKYDSISLNLKGKLEKVLYNFAVENKIGWNAISDPLNMDGENDD